MFDNLSDKLSQTFRTLRGQGKLTDKNIEDAVKDVRQSLLEADVNFKVVKKFVQEVKDAALGTEVLDALSPGQMFVKVVYERLVELLGGEAVGLDLNQKPPVCVMMVGLQGSGKTTTLGKLAKMLKEQKRRPLLVPADVYRPAAIEQLTRLGAQVGVEVFPSSSTDDPVDIAVRAKRQAETQGYDVLLLDTAGRLQIDEDMMEELSRLKAAIAPQEILFVADAMTGQEAVNVAVTFNDRLDLTGVVLSKMDGDARGGAALSIKAVTGKPLKFVGIGEKLDGLEVFHPDRVASRILGMGDVMTLIERAQKVVDQKDAQALQQKMRKAEFTLEDFLNQLNMMRKMGSVSSILGMIPGMRKIAKSLEEGKEGAEVEHELKRIEAIILSMTPRERRHHEILNGSRRRRIAQGSGTSVMEVNRLIKQFMEMRKMMQRFTKLGPRQMLRTIGALGRMN